MAVGRENSVSGVNRIKSSIISKFRKKWKLIRVVALTRNTQKDRIYNSWGTRRAGLSHGL
jgi:hypothetical protein